MNRMTPFKHFLILSASIVLVTGCGARKDGNNGAMAYSTTAEMVQVQDIASTERDIATRICYAYRSKATNFRTPTYTNNFYDFSMSTKDCDEKRNNTSLIATIKPSSTNAVSLLFIPTVKTTAQFYDKIQTTESGFLSQVCEKIQSNQPISNTVAVEDSTTSVQLRFFKDDLDSYTLSYFTKSKDGKMKISSAETFKVRTQFNLSSTQILGMDEMFLRQTTCADPTKYTDFIQRFSGSRAQ